MNEPTKTMLPEDLLSLAKEAGDAGEIPVACAIQSNDGEHIVVTHNRVEELHDITAHAEVLAIRKYSERTGRKHLDDVTLYVTMEPCPMCADAIISARIPKVVCYSHNTRMGAFGSLFNLNDYPLESKPEIIFLPEYEERSLALVQNFFKEKRKLPKYKKVSL